MKNRICLFLVLITLVLSLSGCWDKVELENRGFAISVGIDKLEKNEDAKSTYPNRYKVAVALPKLSSFSSKEGGGSEEEARMIKKNLAPTVPGGMITANENTSERLDYSHIKLIIFGGNLLKDELLFKEALDGFERVSDINRRILITATGGEAEKIFDAKSGGQSMVGLFVTNFYENNSKKASTTFKENLEKLLIQLRDNGCGIIPRIEVKDEQVALEGAALIQDYKLVGWLTPKDITQILFLREDGMGVELLTKFNDILLKCRVLKQTADFDFTENNNKLKLIINLDVDGEIEEYIMSNKNLFDSKLLNEFQKLYEKQLNKDISDTLKKIQNDYDADFFHFEKLLNKKKYKLWEKYHQNWKEVYKNMEIEVISNVNIRSLGITK